MDARNAPNTVLINSWINPEMKRINITTCQIIIDDNLELINITTLGDVLPVYVLTALVTEDGAAAQKPSGEGSEALPVYSGLKL